MKTRLANSALWMAYLLALAASISHVAWTFNTLEQPSHVWAGWVAAIAVDAGLAALAYAIQQRKRAGRSVRSLWAGVIVFASISAYANTLHALSLSGDMFKAIVLSATLPLLVVYLGEIVSSDDAAAMERAERERTRFERELARAERIEAERLAAEAASQRATSESKPFVCGICANEFGSQPALNAHKRVHSNGKA